MTPQILTADQLIGIREKLKRANENILNLNTEINAFLNMRPDSPLSDDKNKAAQELGEFWAKRSVDPRFSVITGEIVHHLRSCLDHIVWSLSSDAYRSSHERDIGFPLMTKKKPWTKNEISRYDGQIGGIVSDDAIAIIDNLQPWHAAEPADDPLAIVHELNRIDKHHNLVLVVTTFNANITLFIPPTVRLSAFETNQELPLVVQTPKLQFNLSPQIAFGEFGKRKNQPVTPALTELCNAVADVVSQFAGDST